MRTKSAPAASLPELSLATATFAPSTRSWPAVVACGAKALDTRFWQTRGARGISWNRSGTSLVRRLAH